MIINYTSMAAPVSCPKHNMVACLEKTERNAQFHEIFWNTTTSKTVNDVSYIKAKVASKTVSISKASIRRDLLFHDVDEIDYRKFNFSKMIFEGMIRNLDAKKQFLMYPRFVQVFLNNQLSNLPAPLDNLPIPVLTKKVFTDIAKQGLYFSGHVTPLFPNMLAQVVVDKGAGDQPPMTESSYKPDTTQVPRDSLEGIDESKGDQVQSSNDRPHSGGNTSEIAEGGLNLQKGIKKLEKKCKPSISHHRAWLKSVQRLSMKKRLGKMEFVSKQGRKNAKSKPTLDAFDDLDNDLAHGMDYMETEEVMNEGRQSNETKELNLDVDTEVIAEDKGSGEKGGSTVDTARLEVDTARPEVDTARPKVDTARPDVDVARQEISAVEPRTPLTTTSIFDDEDITMAQTLIKMKEEKSKEKGVAFKDVEDSSRPARSVLILKPLPSIDPKDKGKGILVEEEPIKIKRKDQGIDQIEKDEELSHKLHEEELAEIARIQEEKATLEEASRVAIMEIFDEFQAGIDVDALFAAKL
ncbi:hypothetical protein Tco_1553800 [Tanacetum coccineum]